MKLKSLILGSVAAAGLSTAGYAADLGVLTSLDVCDALGLSGLTISSDTNCLQISGGVEYEFSWGDYDTDSVGFADLGYDTFELDEGDDGFDWNSRVDYWMKFVGSADSDFGRAQAVVRFEGTEQTIWGSADRVDPDRDYYDDAEEVSVFYSDGSSTDGLVIDEAYVSVGDSTVISAGLKSSIANFGDDEPLNFLGLFNSEAVDEGVGARFWTDAVLDSEYLRTGGHVIQVVSALGNGVSVGVGLENLDANDIDDPAPGGDEPLYGFRSAGTLVGVVSYAGDGISAHVTGLAGGVLDGEVEAYAIHAGFTGTFDMFQVRAAGAYENAEIDGVDFDSWNVLASAAATFDLFTIAVSGEAASSDTSGVVGYDDDVNYGFGGSIGANVTDGVSINLGARYFDDNTVIDAETYQVALQVVAAVTESISVTGEIGYVNVDAPVVLEEEDAFYGAAELGWAPGGDFTSTLRGEVNTLDAYKVTFNAAKTFQ